MEGPGRRVYPVWRGASPQRRELPAHCELALRNPRGDCGRVLRLDVEEDRLDLSRRAAPRRRGHLLALLLPCGLNKGATAITRSALTDPLDLCILHVYTFSGGLTDGYRARVQVRKQPGRPPAEAVPIENPGSGNIPPGR